MSEMNGLTAAEEEMLVVTMEEASELIKACSKVYRFGLGKQLGPRLISTRESLEEESGDVSCCLMILEKNGLISSKNVQGHMEYKFSRMREPGQQRFHYITPDMVPL